MWWGVKNDDQWRGYVTKRCEYDDMDYIFFDLESPCSQTKNSICIYDRPENRFSILEALFDMMKMMMMANLNSNLHANYYFSYSSTLKLWNQHEIHTFERRNIFWPSLNIFYGLKILLVEISTCKTSDYNFIHVEYLLEKSGKNNNFQQKFHFFLQ